MTFSIRLKKILKAGNLRVSDLARWFERPHATVRGWVNQGMNPSGTAADIAHLTRLLEILERRVDKCEGFPVPSLSLREHKNWIDDIRQQVSRQILTGRP